MALGFFSAGVQLPHPPIAMSVILIIEEALRASWKILRSQHRDDFDIATAQENAVTEELYETLVDVVFAHGLVAGFDQKLFTTVTRESKLRNYNGEILNKMPDLLIGLVDRLTVFKPSQDWLFIECKPIDSEHTLGKHYCNKGLIRFVVGEYAWAMSTALMIGYVNKDYEPLERFSRVLRNKIGGIITREEPHHCDLSTYRNAENPTIISVHERAFNYVETCAQAPPITLRHLWFLRS